MFETNEISIFFLSYLFVFYYAWHIQKVEKINFVIGTDKSYSVEPSPR